MEFWNDLEKNCTPPLPIVVVTHKKPVSAIMCCRDWIGVRTHWWGGHTIACCGTDNCEPCNANRQWVKKYYIVAKGLNTGTLALLMLTPGAAEMIVAGRGRVDGFLGCVVRLARAAKRDTAPMSATLVGFEGKTEDFGTDRLERCVLRIFRENIGAKA